MEFSQLTRRRFLARAGGERVTTGALRAGVSTAFPYLIEKQD